MWSGRRTRDLVSPFLLRGATCLVVVLSVWTADSYMIYSGAFNALPAAARDAIYRRLWKVLSGEERDVKYSRLSVDDRRAIVEILDETKSDLPECSPSEHFRQRSLKN